MIIIYNIFASVTLSDNKLKENLIIVQLYKNSSQRFCEELSVSSNALKFRENLQN